MKEKIQWKKRLSEIKALIMDPSKGGTLKKIMWKTSDSSSKILPKKIKSLKTEPGTSDKILKIIRMMLVGNSITMNCSTKEIARIKLPKISLAHKKEPLLKIM